MRTDTSNIVGFVTDEVVTTPYAVDIIRGAQDALWARGKLLMIVNAGYDREKTRASFEALLERRVEGILYAAMFHHAVDIPALKTDVPVVLVNCFSENRQYTSVIPDEVAGGYTATRRLLSNGHRRIGFINISDPGKDSPPPTPAAEGRLAGYKQALDEFGVPFEESLVVYTGQTTAENREVTRRIMQADKPPTGIFCATDFIAMGCYAGLASLGLTVPDDVAVVGFDNREDLVLGMWPPLTSVALPHYEMGRWAAEYLMSRYQTTETPGLHRVDCPLVPRESA
jgi:LacI family transcriptional regulator